MFENKSKSSIESLGEFKLIHHLTDSFETNQKNTIVGIGDDAAVLDSGEYYTLITNDLLIEGVHFDFSYSPFKHLGYKAVAVNVSDIAAMNGVATQILVSVGLSSKISLEAIEEFYIGVKAACEKYNVDLVGGDTSSSRSGMFVSVTAIGKVQKDKLVKRKGANPGDLVCVSGDLGAAYTGYQLLEREKRIFLENPSVQPDLEGNDYILQRQLKPEARVDIVDLLNEIKVLPTAMIDISDGLSSELFHLAEHSQVGFRIYEDKLPIDPTAFQTARDLGLDPTICALNGGEDYELLFTVSQADYDKIKSNLDITVVGYCTEKIEGIQMVSRNENLYPLEAQGWTNFKG